MSNPPKKKLPLVKLAAAAVVLAAVALIFLRGSNPQVWKDRFIELGQNAGPFVFFLVMALLPILPVPMLAFTLTAGTLFADRLGMPLVLALSALAVTFNFILTYALARWALRPLVERIMTRLGYEIPRIPDADITSTIVLFRVTPGIPFVVQNYLLGLANVPFGRYVVVSFLSASIPSMAYVIFGDALLHGNGRVIMLSICVIAALAAATHLVRKHLSARGQARS